MMGVTAIVAENQDPELQHRVKVVIPSIDEDMVFDEWARQMVFCLGNGFGTAFIPVTTCIQPGLTGIGRHHVPLPEKQESKTSLCI